MPPHDTHGGAGRHWGHARCWLIGCVMLLSWMLHVTSATGQVAPDTRWTHDTTHVVTSLSLPTDTRQLVIEQPPNTTIDSVDVLHYGARAVPFEAEQRPTGWTLQFDAPQQGPFEVVMRVHTGAATSRALWQLTPLTGDEAVQVSSTQTELAIEPAPEGRTTWAWQLPESADVLPRTSRTNEHPLVPQQQPQAFTLAFWMRTLRRDAVIASTWTGASEAPYPLELVTGPAGRLQVYHGTGTQHHPVRTGVVVADGRWHYVAVTYERASRRTAVYIDGARVASEQRPPRLAGRAPLTFGGRPNDRTRPADALRSFEGQLAWVQIIPEALNADALHRLRTTATPHPQAVAYGPWPNPERPNEGPTASAIRSTLPLSAPTPISDWQAQVERNEVVLSWTAAHDSGRYVVERSTDQVRWSVFATRTPNEGVRHTEDERRYTVTDATSSADVVFYRVRHVTETAPAHMSPVLKVGRGALSEREEQPTLIGNFPNPFREETTIAFELPRATEVMLTVWTITGAPVQELTARTYPAGYHEVNFQPGDLPSGTYFVRFETDQHTEAHRMVMLR